MCIFIYLISNLSITVTKKFRNELEIKLELKGKDLIEMISMVIIGGLGILPTCGAGCSSRYLKE